MWRQDRLSPWASLWGASVSESTPAPAPGWRPAATLQTLRLRAALLARARDFFASRHVLEVDTPIVVNAPVSDVHIESAQVVFAGHSQPYFLHTSPEYAMKRLLAAGSGDIYQICHVARGHEQGRHHNPEFTLVEWYRLGYSLDALMDEVAALVRTLLTPLTADNEPGSDDAIDGPAHSATPPLTAEKLTYREVFLRETGLDPFIAGLPQLLALARQLDFQADSTGRNAQELRDELLDLIMGALIGPRLGSTGLTFIYAYPASQAALARVDPADPRAALRFELYHRGVELANGFHELASAAEQRHRFEQDNAIRNARGLPVAAPDERLLDALACGLPDCAGVALGFDRLMMLAAGAATIDEVLTFCTGHA
jgi:elongation factor P--(R)-beta-lysine ligase